MKKLLCRVSQLFLRLLYYKAIMLNWSLVKQKTVLSFLESTLGGRVDCLDKAVKHLPAKLLDKLASMLDYENVGLLRYSSLYDVFNIPHPTLFSKIRFDCCESLTTDGTYLYLLLNGVNGGLFKIGTGQNGSMKGHLYLKKPFKYTNADVSWIYCAKKLYFRSTEFQMGAFSVYSPETLEQVSSTAIVIPDDIKTIERIPLVSKGNNLIAIVKENMNLNTDKPEKIRFHLLVYDFSVSIDEEMTEDKTKMVDELYQSFTCLYPLNDCKAALQMNSWDILRAAEFLIENGKPKNDTLVLPNKRVVIETDEEFEKANTAQMEWVWQGKWLIAYEMQKSRAFFFETAEDLNEVSLKRKEDSSNAMKTNVFAQDVKGGYVYLVRTDGINCLNVFVLHDNRDFEAKLERFLEKTFPSAEIRADLNSGVFSTLVSAVDGLAIRLQNRRNVVSWRYSNWSAVYNEILASDYNKFNSHQNNDFSKKHKQLVKLTKSAAKIYQSRAEEHFAFSEVKEDSFVFNDGKKGVTVDKIGPGNWGFVNTCKTEKEFECIFTEENKIVTFLGMRGDNAELNILLKEVAECFKEKAYKEAYLRLFLFFSNLSNALLVDLYFNGKHEENSTKLNEIVLQFKSAFEESKNEELLSMFGSLVITGLEVVKNETVLGLLHLLKERESESPSERLETALLMPNTACLYELLLRRLKNNDLAPLFARTRQSTLKLYYSKDKQVFITHLSLNYTKFGSIMPKQSKITPPEAYTSSLGIDLSETLYGKKLNFLSNSKAILQVLLSKIPSREPVFNELLNFKPSNNLISLFTHLVYLTNQFASFPLKDKLVDLLNSTEDLKLRENISLFLNAFVLSNKLDFNTNLGEYIETSNKLMATASVLRQEHIQISSYDKLENIKTFNYVLATNEPLNIAETVKFSDCLAIGVEIACDPVSSQNFSGELKIISNQHDYNLSDSSEQNYCNNLGTSFKFGVSGINGTSIVLIGDELKLSSISHRNNSHTVTMELKVYCFPIKSAEFLTKAPLGLVDTVQAVSCLTQFNLLGIVKSVMPTKEEKALTDPVLKSVLASGLAASPEIDVLSKNVKEIQELKIENELEFQVSTAGFLKSVQEFAKGKAETISENEAVFKLLDKVKSVVRENMIYTQMKMRPTFTPKDKTAWKALEALFVLVTLHHNNILEESLLIAAEQEIPEEFKHNLVYVGNKLNSFVSTLLGRFNSLNLHKSVKSDYLESIVDTVNTVLDEIKANIIAKIEESKVEPVKKTPAKAVKKPEDKKKKILARLAPKKNVRRKFEDVKKAAKKKPIETPVKKELNYSEMNISELLEHFEKESSSVITPELMNKLPLDVENKLERIVNEIFEGNPKKLYAICDLLDLKYVDNIQATLVDYKKLIQNQVPSESYTESFGNFQKLDKTVFLELFPLDSPYKGVFDSLVDNLLFLMALKSKRGDEEPELTRLTSFVAKADSSEMDVSMSKTIFAFLERRNDIAHLHRILNLQLYRFKIRETWLDLFAKRVRSTFGKRDTSNYGAFSFLFSKSFTEDCETVSTSEIKGNIVELLEFSINCFKSEVDALTQFDKENTNYASFKNLKTRQFRVLLADIYILLTNLGNFAKFDLKVSNTLVEYCLCLLKVYFKENVDFKNILSMLELILSRLSVSSIHSEEVLKILFAEVQKQSDSAFLSVLFELIYSVVTSKQQVISLSDQIADGIKELVSMAISSPDSKTALFGSKIVKSAVMKIREQDKAKLPFLTDGSLVKDISVKIGTSLLSPSKAEPSSEYKVILHNNAQISDLQYILLALYEWEERNPTKISEYTGRRQSGKPLKLHSFLQNNVHVFNYLRNPPSGRQFGYILKALEEKRVSLEEAAKTEEKDKKKKVTAQLKHLARVREHAKMAAKINENLMTKGFSVFQNTFSLEEATKLCDLFEQARLGKLELIPTEIGSNDKLLTYKYFYPPLPSSEMLITGYSTCVKELTREYFKPSIVSKTVANKIVKCVEEYSTANSSINQVKYSIKHLIKVENSHILEGNMAFGESKFAVAEEMISLLLSFAEGDKKSFSKVVNDALLDENSSLGMLLAAGGTLNFKGVGTKCTFEGQRCKIVSGGNASGSKAADVIYRGRKEIKLDSVPLSKLIKETSSLSEFAEIEVLERLLLKTECSTTKMLVLRVLAQKVANNCHLGESTLSAVKALSKKSSPEDISELETTFVKSLNNQFRAFQQADYLFRGTETGETKPSVKAVSEDNLIFNYRMPEPYINNQLPKLEDLSKNDTYLKNIYFFERYFIEEIHNYCRQNYSEREYNDSCSQIKYRLSIGHVKEVRNDIFDIYDKTESKIPKSRDLMKEYHKPNKLLREEILPGCSYLARLPQNYRRGLNGFKEDKNTGLGEAPVRVLLCDHSFNVALVAFEDFTQDKLVSLWLPFESLAHLEVPLGPHLSLATAQKTEAALEQAKSALIDSLVNQILSIEHQNAVSTGKFSKFEQLLPFCEKQIQRHFNDNSVEGPFSFPSIETVNTCLEPFTKELVEYCSKSWDEFKIKQYSLDLFTEYNKKEGSFGDGPQYEKVLALHQILEDKQADSCGFVLSFSNNCILAAQAKLLFYSDSSCEKSVGQLNAFKSEMKDLGSFVFPCRELFFKYIPGTRVFGLIEWPNSPLDSILSCSLSTVPENWASLMYLTDLTASSLAKEPSSANLKDLSAIVAKLVSFCTSTSVASDLQKLFFNIANRTVLKATQMALSLEKQGSLSRSSLEIEQRLELLGFSCDNLIAVIKNVNSLYEAADTGEEGANFFSSYVVEGVELINSVFNFLGESYSTLDLVFSNMFGFTLPVWTEAIVKLGQILSFLQGTASLEPELRNELTGKLSISNQLNNVFLVSGIGKEASEEQVRTEFLKIARDFNCRLVDSERDVRFSEGNLCFIVDGYLVTSLTEKEAEEEEDPGYKLCNSCNMENDAGNESCVFCDADLPEEVIKRETKKKRLANSETYNFTVETLVNEFKNCLKNSKFGVEDSKIEVFQGVEIVKEKNDQLNNFFKDRFTAYLEEGNHIKEQISKLKADKNQKIAELGAKLSDLSAEKVKAENMIELYNKLQIEGVDYFLESTAIEHTSLDLPLLEQIRQVVDKTVNNETSMSFLYPALGIRFVADGLNPVNHTSLSSVLNTFPELGKARLADLRYCWTIVQYVNSCFEKSIPFIKPATPANDESAFPEGLSDFLVRSKGIFFASFKASLLRDTCKYTEMPSDQIELPSLSFERMKIQAAQEKPKPLEEQENVNLRQSSPSKSLFVTAFEQAQKVDRTFFRSGKTANDAHLAFKVEFIGEMVEGNGGPYRQFFSDMSDELCNNKGDLMLLIKTPNNVSQSGEFKDKMIPNTSYKGNNLLNQYEFLGLLFGICIRTGVHLPLELPSYLWKKIVLV